MHIKLQHIKLQIIALHFEKALKMFTGGIRTDAMDPRQKCSKLRVI
jgi:hypothetical protein